MFLSFTCKFCAFKVVVVPPTVKSPVSVRFAPCAVPVKVGLANNVEVFTAISLELTVMCVPAPTFKVISPANPPPVRPAPAIISRITPASTSSVDSFGIASENSD